LNKGRFIYIIRNGGGERGKRRRGEKRGGDWVKRG